jgi:6-phosphogluconolactonase
MAEFHIAQDHLNWVRMGAQFIVERAENALEKTGRFVIALSGGSTPRPIYNLLPALWSQEAITWEQVHLLWGDERCVPLDHPHSNYRMAREAFIDRIDIPMDNIHPMRCADDIDASALAYEDTLRGLFPESTWPTVDLILLGVGTDGHTASLFPNSPALERSDRWVVPNHIPGIEHKRLTLTLPVINAARTVAFLVEGSKKAEILGQVMRTDEDDIVYPAQLIAPTSGQLHWFLDSEAGKLIEINES